MLNKKQAILKMGTAFAYGNDQRLKVCVILNLVPVEGCLQGSFDGY